MHMMVGIYVVVQRGNTMSLGFTGMGFLTKSIGMMFLLYFGVVILDLNYKIYVPLLAFFWFFTHIVEAFVKQHYMKQNESSLIKNLQIKWILNKLGDIYKSNGHPKAKGLNFQLRPPLGFQELETDYPNTVKQWKKQNGEFFIGLTPR